MSRRAVFILASVVLASCSWEASHHRSSPAPECDADNGGLSLPAGFCAAIVLDSLPAIVRGIAVDSVGHLYTVSIGQGVRVHWDSDGDGRFDKRQRIMQRSGVALTLLGDTLWLGSGDVVLRTRVDLKGHETIGPLDTVVMGLPTKGEHTAKPLVIDGSGSLFVAIGSESNSCQEENRTPNSPGIDPCPELARRAGVWRFSSEKLRQHFDSGHRFVSGARSIVGFAQSPETKDVFAALHGVDDFHLAWPSHFTAELGANLPSESFVLLRDGDDHGWPYCYYDMEARAMKKAPGYGGDGTAACDRPDVELPLTGFPGRSGPNAMRFYTGTQFPERYRNGAFVSLHGPTTWTEHTKLGYSVVFVPFRDGRPAGDYEVFASGFAGPSPSAPRYRPMGLAVGTDGSLFISAAARGRVWRIFWKGSGTGT